MSKKLISLLISLTLICGLLLGACGKENHEGDLKVYYLSLDFMSIVPDYYEMEQEEGDAAIEQYLTLLSQTPINEDIRKTIPDSVSVLGYAHNDYMLSLDLSASYYDMSATEELLVRAAIVKTLCQVSGVTYVFFTIEGEPLVNARGENVGMMNAETFVENPDEAINVSQETTLTLYFASEDGTYLVPEKRTVHYSSNETLEKLIIERLIIGPKTSGLLATVPPNTRIITVSLIDGVCYVNLDSSFLNQNQLVTEGTVLYSIVNSLTELEEVERVQLSVNGDTSGMVRYVYELSNMYERDENFFTAPEPAQSDTEEDNTWVEE